MCSTLDTGSSFAWTSSRLGMSVLISRQSHLISCQSMTALKSILKKLKRKPTSDVTRYCMRMCAETICSTTSLKCAIPRKFLKPYSGNKISDKNCTIGANGLCKYLKISHTMNRR